ncbi:hypothetical protein B484DRAFT_402790 [Ochromonadaceae sp. CCMP2298]|nr:hypothetical protein B484DRAFT_402790 [Ochromonadaceae sp. CCMP2298]
MGFRSLAIAQLGRVRSSAVCSRVLRPLDRTLARGQSSFSGGQFLSYRDVFLLDHAGFDLVHWLEANAGNTALIKHPSCKHAVAIYAKYIHENSSYNFNDLGEYSLNISAAQLMTDEGSAGGFGAGSPSPECPAPSMLVWPDAVALHNLTPTDMPALCKALLTDTAIDWPAICRGLSSSVQLTDLPNTTLVCSVSGRFPVARVRQAAGWFQQAVAERAGTPTSPLHCYIATEMGAHRNATHVMVLSRTGTCADGAGEAGGEEECFEYLSGLEQVRSIVKKLPLA